jgi:Asp-tRNA(Asn)/Glu-tRNA(Gln) amidotransferase A subunit family amidase
VDFRSDTVERLAGRIRKRELPAVEVVGAALDRIAKLNDEINAFVTLDAERALEQAAAIDEQLARGESVGPLAGVPIGVKDLEDAAGFVTSYGSDLHNGDPPAQQDSIAVGRLRAAGCVILGKTNSPEFGFKATTDNGPFGVTRNPWDPTRSPGGSSGGSAAAIASGMIPLATGSDGGGSIRIPSAVCGLSGIKPSQGRVPLGGRQAPTVGVLAVRGPMASRIRDVALALDVMVGPDPTDMYSLSAPAEKWRPQLSQVRAPAAVIWSPTMGFAEIDREVLGVCESAVRRLQETGTKVIERQHVFSGDPVRPWLTLWTVGLARKLGHFREREEWERIDPGLRNMIELGIPVSGQDHALALDACHHLNLRLQETLDSAPFILTPTVAGQTPEIGKDGTINGKETVRWVSLTYGINMTRNPAATICAGLTRDRMPVGLQIIGRQQDDLGVLHAAAFLEDLIGFKEVAPV